MTEGVPTSAAGRAPGSIPCPYCGEPGALLFGTDVPLPGIATYHCPQCGAAPWRSFRPDLPEPVECPHCGEFAGVRQVSGLPTKDEVHLHRTGFLRVYFGCGYAPTSGAKVCRACEYTWTPRDGGRADRR